MQNLRARLARIRRQGGETVLPDPAVLALRGSPPIGAARTEPGREGWTDAGYKTLRRTFTLPLEIPPALPATLCYLLPDLDRYRMNTPSGECGRTALVAADHFLFFDLETTGLSGGAGTLAFLAAFGRFTGAETGDVYGLEITQFLLLDYPGEADFLGAVLAFIGENVPARWKGSPGGSPLLTTYNGKAFDSQILKTRCLMNGFQAPALFQVDLLHPSRRLWKRILPNCSQATIETMVLGLDRTGDMPGSLAPDIWFAFLRSGGEFPAPSLDEVSGPCQALGQVCDHNVRDIAGLAELFRAFTEIASAPLEGIRGFRCDGERLALSWRRAILSGGVCPGLRKEAGRLFPGDEGETAEKLLEAAALDYPRSCLRLGFDCFRAGRREEGRAALLRLAGRTGADAGSGTIHPWKVPCAAAVRAMALRALSIDAERHLGRKDRALAYIEAALTPEGNGAEGGALPPGLRRDLERRRERLSG
ncbi:MAG: ribonuclease H-like domain-containing protein [Treponema sp.]|nr:ribonuclease H-like domain-containing protein [Treponema sp.]